MRSILKKLVGTILLLTATVAVSLVLTAGIFTDEIKMKNVDAPFIDLDVMVEDLSISSEGGDSAEEETVVDDVVNEFVISIRETDISINGKVVSKENFSGIFNAIHKSGVPVRLVDDYAEYHTYIFVLEYLSEKGIRPVEEKL